MKQKERKKRRQYIIIVIILLSFIPSSLVLILLTVFEKSEAGNQTVAPIPTQVVRDLNSLTPADITKDVLYYTDKEVYVHGRVVLGDKNCVERICNQADTCCGCDATRDLFIEQSSKGALEEKSQIHLYGPEKSPLCQKKANSCDYECSDWEPDQLYEIHGNVVAIRPPGMTLSRGYLEYYLEVKDKNKINDNASAEKESRLEKLIKKYVDPLFNPKLP